MAVTATRQRPSARANHHRTYWAFLVHRISGVALALFLPVHLWVLGLAIEGAAALDGFLAWTANPLMKLAETLLILLLAAHLTGGLRLLAVEFLPWSNAQKAWVAVAAGISVACGLLFLLNVT